MLLTKLLMALFSLLWPYLPQRIPGVGGTVSASATPTNQKLISGSVTMVAASSRFYDLSAVNLGNTSALRIPVASAGTFQNLYVACQATPGSGTYTFTFQYSATTTPVGTALAVAISSANFAGAADTTDQISVAVGGYVDIAATEASSPTNGILCSWSIEFAPTTANQYMITGWSDGNITTSVGTNEFSPLMGGTGALSSVEINQTFLSPMTGTITACYAYLATAAGAGNARSWNINQNGSPVLTAQTWSNTNGLKSVTGLSLSVAQGDLWDHVWSATGSALANSVGYWACSFTPTTAGQFPLTAVNLSGTSQVLTFYGKISGLLAPSATEANFQTILTSDMSLVKVCTYTTAAVTGTKTFTFSLRENGAAAGTTFSTALNAASTTVCSSASPYVIPTNYNLYNMQVTPANTPPSGSVILASWVGFM